MSHNHTFHHAGAYEYRIALTFVKPRGGEGQNGRLKCPFGFPVTPLIGAFAVVFLQYFTFSVMLVMIGCAVFLQLSTIHKFSMLALMSAVFVVLLRVVYKDLFISHDSIHHCW